MKIRNLKIGESSEIGPGASVVRTQEGFEYTIGDKSTLIRYEDEDNDIQANSKYKTKDVSAGIDFLKAGVRQLKERYSSLDLIGREDGDVGTVGDYVKQMETAIEVIKENVI